MHEGSAFQLLPATGWFSSKREPKGIIYSLINLCLNFSELPVQKDNRKKGKLFESGNHRPNWHCSWWEIPIYLQKMKRNWLKNVTETECLAFYHQKSSDRSQHVPAECWRFFCKWHCFSEEKWFYCNQLYGESSTKTSSLAVLIPILRSKTICESWLSQYWDICVLLTGVHAAPRT